MRRLPIALLGIVFCAPQTSAQDTISPETVAAVKHATVFVRVQGSNWKASGSGFVIAADKDSVLIATNHHVIALPENDKKHLTPAELAKSLKVPTVTAVFDGGTKTELSVKAEVIAADQENDLAILRVKGLNAPPTPISYANPPKLVETMGVYTFGYPFGQSLATGKGAPAITVGKATISSLRLDDDGELTLVQIDGALNPGNSGGPVVDTKGHLVGVAVATIKNGQGIGFAIPAAELGKLMKGRVHGFHVTASKDANGKLIVRTDVGVLDPTTAIRGVTLHYVVIPPKGEKPNASDSLAKHPNAKKIALKIDGGLATGELKLDSSEGDLFVQAVADGGTGTASRVSNYSLVLPNGAAGAVVLGPAGGVTGGAGAGEVPPPTGWKEYTATNKTFKVWIPEKNNGQSEKTRSSQTGGKQRLRVSFNSLLVEVAGNQLYSVEQVILTLPPRTKINHNEMMQILREIAVGEGNASVVRETDAKMGRFSGKEYLIQRGTVFIRARTFVIGGSLYLLRVLGTREQVDSADSTVFLESCRLQGVNRPPAGGTGATIAGGAPTDPEFKDPVPDKGALVGLELALVAKPGSSASIRSMRAVFRVGDKETFGPWHGPSSPDAIKDTVKLIAKPGYVIGALNVKAGMQFDGLSVTFMKLTNDKLDPKDSYDSQWVGTKEGVSALTTISTKGGTITGLIGRTNATGVTGVGLLSVEKAPNPVVPPKVANRGPRIHGGGSEEHRDAAPPNGVLVGLEVGMGKWFNNDVVTAIRPIYRVGEKESFGEQFGTSTGNTIKVVAKPGYAVGSIKAKAAGGLDGFSITFMKLVDGKLDPKDSYESEWIGGQGGGAPVLIGGDGTLVVGLLLKTNTKNVTALGLIYSDTNTPQLDGVWPKGVPSKIQGGGADREFREAGSDGALLVGLEVGVGRFLNNAVVVSVRPIFRAGDKETLGEWHGPTEKGVKEVIKVVAKPGYAVAGISVRTGLGMDGLSLTFRKVVDGKLDPNDSYESDWVGGMGGRGSVKIGDGTPVIGLIGKARADTVSGLGLLYPAPEKK